MGAMKTQPMHQGYSLLAIVLLMMLLGFGLSQQGALRQAARDSYAQGLERLLYRFSTYALPLFILLGCATRPNRPR